MESRMELLPGVYLRVFQTDKFKTDYLSLSFVRPLTANEAPHAALLPSLLLRGTRSYPDIRSISTFLDAHYGASIGTMVRKKGEIQTTGFYADFLDERLLPAGEQVFEPMMDFLGELLFCPCMENGLFSPDAMEGEKRNLLDTIDWTLNDKRSYAVTRMLETMCKDEAYGIPRLGTREAAEAITLQSISDYYRDLLAHSRLELFYMGHRKPDDVAAALAKMLAPLPRDCFVPLPEVGCGSCGETRTVEEVLDVTQGKLCMGFRSGITSASPRYPAFILLNAVFGAGPTSKLFMNVREKMSLCYYASSSINSFKGIMIVSSGIEFANYELAKSEILRQLDACVQGDITDEELENARRSVLSSFRASLDSPGRMEDHSLSCAINGKDVEIEALMAQIAAVTPAQVQEAAACLKLDTVYFLKGETE